MARIVQKFGGTSVADAARVRAVAEIIAAAARRGDQVVAVLSAQGDTTDRLLAKARELGGDYPARELDVLLSTGEQISVSLCAAVLRQRGLYAVSLTGWQAGLLTDAVYGNAAVRGLSSDRIERELESGKIVLVAGFQGVDGHGNITTLGRGGSDTTAVALAAFLHADLCEIYTDVRGVYDKDPRLHGDAVKLDRIDYDAMLRLIADGAQVLHDRSVLLAKKYRLPVVVRSAFCDDPGTVVADQADS